MNPQEQARHMAAIWTAAAEGKRVESLRPLESNSNRSEWQEQESRYIGLYRPENLRIASEPRVPRRVWINGYADNHLVPGWSATKADSDAKTELASGLHAIEFLEVLPPGQRKPDELEETLIEYIIRPFPSKKHHLSPALQNLCDILQSRNLMKLDSEGRMVRV